PNVDLFSIDSPGQHSVDAIDCLLVMIMSMRRCRQALRARDNELKGRDGAIRVFSSDQEAYRERPETDGLVGRIDVEADGLLCHVCIFLAHGVYRATITKGNSLLRRLRPPDTLSSASAVERISALAN